MAIVKDKVGERFGKLIVIEYAGRDRKNRVLWRCDCDCGGSKITTTGNLGNRANSCGCIIGKSGTHGMRNSRTYKSWVEMRQRCSNPNRGNYKYYGGKGISVCERWEKFENFFKDMGDRPEGMSIDRKDRAGNYEPSNCRWSDKYEQANNKSNNVFIECNGESKTIAEWAREYNLMAGTLWSRIHKGMKPPKCFAKIGDIPRGGASHQQANNRQIDRAHQ